MTQPPARVPTARRTNPVSLAPQRLLTACQVVATPRLEDETWEPVLRRYYGESCIHPGPFDQCVRAGRWRRPARRDQHDNGQHIAPSDSFDEASPRKPDNVGLTFTSNRRTHPRWWYRDARLIGTTLPGVCCRHRWDGCHSVAAGVARLLGLGRGHDHDIAGWPRVAGAAAADGSVSVGVASAFVDPPP
jgi:hypothetical protein